MLYQDFHETSLRILNVNIAVRITGLLIHVLKVGCVHHHKHSTKNKPEAGS